MSQRLRYGIHPNIYSEYFLACTRNKSSYYSSNRFPIFQLFTSLRLNSAVSVANPLRLLVRLNCLRQQILHTGGRRPYFLNPHPTD